VAFERIKIQLPQNFVTLSVRIQISNILVATYTSKLQKTFIEGIYSHYGEIYETYNDIGFNHLSFPASFSR
jgi:hypothetical protein